jgi:isopenicillin-N epimerase
VPAAIEFMAQHDWDAVRRWCHVLTVLARDRVNALTGKPALAVANGGWFAQMATMELPRCDHELLQRRLYDEFAVEIPTFSWNGGSWIRVSIQAYNTEADVDTLVRALSRVLPEVVRKN